MDAQTVVQGLHSLSLALTIYEKATKMVRDWADKLVDCPVKQNATKDLERAKETMDVAKAHVAESLGYPLCRKHFPPGIMLKVSEGILQCEQCRAASWNEQVHVDSSVR